MNKTVLIAKDLRREFRSKGEKKSINAVDGVNLRIDAGETLCLLGPNGAGKTTSIKMISTLLMPTGGEITIDGINAVKYPKEARSRLGLVLGGERGFYLRATARDNLLFFADILDVPRRERGRRVDYALDAVALTYVSRSPVEEFSRGMRQRLHIARALLNEPKLLLLDEPTVGLDPEAARDVRQLVRELTSTGTAVLLTTHYLFEAEQLADSIALIMKGKIEITGDVAAIAKRSGITTITTLSLSELLDRELKELQAINGLGQIRSETRGNRTYLYLPWEGSPYVERVSTVLKELRGSVPEDFHTRPATLEESYLTLVDEVVNT